ncbi:uncharacterized protein ACRADG_007274 [Cochliomyia hominivorax]
MLNFQLLPGDKYDGRCAEIYITEKQFLIYHCSICDEIFATFNELFSHINKQHYENTKEYINNNYIEMNEDKVVMKENVDKTFNGEQHEDSKQENQLKALEYKSNLQFEANRVIRCNEIQQTRYCLTETEEPDLLENNEKCKERENLQAIIDNSKTSPQRKKSRLVMGVLKNYNCSRTKLNTITRFPTINHDERKFVCGICGFAFKEKYNLRSHLLRHSNQKHYSCTQCPKRFFTKMEMRFHEYRHKGERSYLCQHCGMGFVSSSSLAQHNKKQHSLNYNPLKCEECNKIFTDMKQFKCHQEEDNDFKCQKLLNNIKEIGFENCDIDVTKEKSINIQQKDNKELGILSENIFSNDDSTAEWLIEEGLCALEQNFDEYELVQTLTDLECNKNV